MSFFLLFQRNQLFSSWNAIKSANDFKLNELKGGGMYFDSSDAMLSECYTFENTAVRDIICVYLFSLTPICNHLNGNMVDLAPSWGTKKTFVSYFLLFQRN